jgi:hypothetical protein
VSEDEDSVRTHRLGVDEAALVEASDQRRAARDEDVAFDLFLESSISPRMSPRITAVEFSHVASSSDIVVDTTYFGIVGPWRAAGRPR